jgi:hypothetical protein
MASALGAHCLSHFLLRLIRTRADFIFHIVSNNVHHCKSIYSAPFYVYTAKKFPGMEGESFHGFSLYPLITVKQNPLLFRVR